MQDTELYQELFGLKAPWMVTKVELAREAKRVDVWVTHVPGALFPCGECGVASPGYDHSEERGWRHLDSCGFMTCLRTRPPRVQCAEHGVRQARLPWAEDRARFTALFQRHAIDVLKEADVLGAARVLRVSWDEAWQILDHAVERGLKARGKRLPEYLGVDEKAAAKGHKYITLVCDLDNACVEYIADDRKTESLDGYFTQFSKEELEKVKAIAMDMWEPYVGSTMKHVPGAADKIVFDRYHVMTHVNKAVNNVRKLEHRALRAVGDETLTGSKYLWLYGRENVPEKRQDEFAALKNADLKTGRAWAVKENLRDLWSYQRPSSAQQYWKRWYFWATHSRLAPVIEAAKTIKRHLHNVMTYFTHRITNAVSEGLNSKIQTIKKMAYGFRNREHFKRAILFHCGGLQLYPVTHGEPG
jgi:transposase